MIDRITPPSWTEWTRNPSERSSQRKAFDDILGELRKEGLIEIRGSLFVHLARYSFLHVKNARIDVKDFLHSVPDSILGQVSPAYRKAEVEAVFRILEAAGLAVILEEDPSGLVAVQLTERRGAGEVARGQVAHTVLTYLKGVFGRWDPAALVVRPASFPTPDSVSKATKVDRAHLSPGEGCALVMDKPESNETNPSPFLQETLDKAAAPLSLLQFWSLPDPKGGGGGTDPEFSLLIPGDLSLSALVRDYCLPVIGEYFRSNEHHDLASEIQAKYSTYMHKYRERFAPNSGIVITDKIDKVLTTADIEGEPFANAAYVVAQVLRGALKEKLSSLRASNNPIVYQAARVAYAHAMALRVRKRKAEKEAAARNQDSTLLVARLKESPRPLSLDELKKTPDATKTLEIGGKYTSLLELLPLVAVREGVRPVIYEVRGTFLHRENLVRAFLEIRERESLAQRERLAQVWARKGIPPVEELFVSERDVSADFLKTFELIHQERVLAANTPEFIRDYIPSERDLGIMAGWLWPEGHRGAITPLEVVTRGLDPILYEDRDRLRRRSLAGVLGLPPLYPLIVKNAWNIVFEEEGLFRFILRRMMAFFGGRPKAAAEDKEIPPKAKKKKSPGVAPGVAMTAGMKAADLRRLKVLAPIVQDRDTLLLDREKMAAQWCLKLDAEAVRRTRDAVDAEVNRLTLLLPLEQMAEENATKVAMFLVEKSGTLGQVTSSRAFHRYLYLTAVLRMADQLSR